MHEIDSELGSQFIPERESNFPGRGNTGCFYSAVWDSKSARQQDGGRRPLGPPVQSVNRSPGLHFSHM